MLNLERLAVFCIDDDRPCKLVEGTAVPRSMVELARLTSATIAARGHVWIKGLPCDSPLMLREFARSLAPELIRYPGGRIDMTGDGTVQQIAGPPSPLLLHCELAYTPFRPDLCFFACQQPAPVGGETLIADGTLVWRLLSSSTQRLFANRHVRYERVYRTQPWKILFGVETLDELAPILGKLDNFRHYSRSDGSVYAEFTTSALTRVNGEFCFANSIVGLAKDHDDIDVRWADGEPIDGEILREVHAALRASQTPVRLAAGDLMILDNWRWLHGRNTFSGERIIYTAFGYRQESTASAEPRVDVSPR